MNFPKVSPLVTHPEESLTPAIHFHVEGSLGSGIHGRKAHMRSRSSKNWFDNRTSAATEVHRLAAVHFLYGMDLPLVV